jgi:A/G-specific adenine glycosylase
MLQQTTVTAVKPYFERFLDRFPTVHALAEADIADVLRLWEGLGYYSRARNLHAAARKIVTEFDGVAPTDVAVWQSLPGIGRYTAGAIVSFAFNRPAPIVEANTLRLYSRLLGFEGDPRSKPGQDLLWSFAGAILPVKSPRDFNSAAMDLGNAVCTPADPWCGECPLRSDCVAFAAGRQATIPRPARRPAITAVHEVCIAVRNNDGETLLVQNAASRRWAGLWDFVRFSVESPPTHSPAGLRSLRAAVQGEFGLTVDDIEPLTVLRHGVTRYRITLHVFAAAFQSGEPAADHVADHRWVSSKQLRETPLSTTGRHVAKMLSEPALFDRPARRRRE